MGVNASRWVTMHGFALNVNNDLSYFENIIPCGISNKSVTSICNELGNEVNKSEIIKKLIKNFEEIFSATLVKTIN